MQVEQNNNDDALQRNQDPPTVPAPLKDEIETARNALKTSLLQLGLILRFYRDVRALGVDNYAARAPSSTTNAMQAAIKQYETACNDMEKRLMRARAIAVQETQPKAILVPAKTEEPAVGTVTSSEEQEPQNPTKAEELPDMAMPVDVTGSPDATAAISGPTQTVLNVTSTVDPTLPSVAEMTTIIDDDEMEDLFGPGTGKTESASGQSGAGPGTATSLLSASNTPATAGVGTTGQSTQEAVADLPLLQDLSASAVPPSLQTEDIPQQSQSQNSMLDDPMASLSSLPNDLDFSSLDINAILAGLSAGQTGEDPLAGMGLDVDVNSLLSGLPPPASGHSEQ